MAIESAGGSIIAMLAELMVEPVGRQFRYMFCFNNFVEEFKERKENLALALDGLQKDVEAAERNAEEIKKGVKKWMEDANSKIEGAKPLENEIGKNGKCFTWCPNCMRQFKLSKALAKKSETFRKLGENSRKFSEVSHIPHRQPIEFLPTKEFTSSESSKEAFEQIMKALKDDSVNMIGLSGKGGVGKTTLVKELGRRAKELQLFSEVLMATVSQNPNVTDIQNQMADKLGLDFKEKSNAGRTDRLWQRLKEVEKMLIILDDVREEIDLKEIGIPFGDDHRGCKILLTTRLQVICSYMECQQKVYLCVLSEKEAWDLFRINAGLRDGDSTLNRVAREVARECQGLPIALVTVGRALRDKSAVQWEVASKQLKDSQFPRMEQFDEQKNAFTCLKLSYENLKHEETKLCFLLCSLFPEDYDIPIEDLMRYTVGYWLHQDEEPIEDAREQVHVAIKDLKACCLLLGTETEEHVRMHDLVRDVAIQIASSKEYGFMVKAGIGLKEWPMINKSFEGCTTISLMGNKLAELPEGLVCPKLKVLLLELDDGMNVPERFFEGMKEIEVLSLKGGCLSLHSLELSTKLKSLVLIRCGCKDLIWLRKLQRLKILGLMWCLSIEELPDEIGDLKELRLLDVTGCRRLRRIPVNLIGRLKKLEELLIGDCSFDGWDVVGCDSTGGMNASLTELNSLSNLAVLSLKIPEVESIPRDFVFPGLLKYDIIIGNYNPFIRDPVGYPTSTRLHLDNTSATSLNAKISEQLFPTVSQIVFRRVEGLKNIVLLSDHKQQNGFFQRLEFVEVWHCGDICTLFPAKVLQVLKNLRSVKINGCKSLEEVFELDDESNVEDELPLLSSLTRLELEMLPELKCIWKGPTRHVSLQSLIHLNLNRLHKLTFIFTPSLAQSLPRLEKLEIRNCLELKHVLREEDDEWEIIPESLGFPKLKTLYIFACAELEYVFPVTVSPSLQNLEEIRIDNANNLKQIFYSEGDARIITFPQLRELILWSESNYSFFGPKNFAAQLPSLQNLTIHGHEELGNLLVQLQGFSDLKHIYVRECGGAQDGIQVVSFVTDGRGGHELSLPSLEKLYLNSLPDMRCIWKGLVLCNLTILVVNGCKRLTHVFTYGMIASLVQLKVLKTSSCEELEQIIAKDDDERYQMLSGDHLISLCFPSLCEIEVEECNKLKSLFPVAMASGIPELQLLKITKASQFLGVFGQNDQASHVNVEKEMVLPKLKELSLEQLPCIVCFSFGCCDFLFPRLEKLKVYECAKLSTKFATTPDGSMSAQSEISQVAEDSSSNREWTRDYGWKEGGNLLAQLQMAAHGHGQQNSFLQRLEFVQVRDCGDVRTSFPAKLLQALKNLKSVEIEDCKSLEEVFELGEADEGISEEKELPLLSSLTELQLRGLPELKCIWKEPTRHVSLQSLTLLNLYSLNKLTFIFTLSLAQSLPKLERLEISDCGELKYLIREEDGEREIIPESPSFPELKTIIVYDCGKLEYVFPVSVCPSLLSLEVMWIFYSDNLKQIFYNGEGDTLTTYRIIEFPRLRKLALYSTSNYSFFGSKNIPAHLPSLQNLCLSGHEELGNLSTQLQQNGFLQRLEFVRVDDCGDVRPPFPAKLLRALKNLKEVIVDSCKSLEEVFELGEADEGSSEEKEMPLLSSLTELKLKILPELKCIWKGPTRHVNLQSLINLELYALDKLTFIFTPSLAYSLPKLQRLYISDCGELKHIIREEDGEREIIPESPCFPQLKNIYIYFCDKLEYVFPVSLSHNRDGIIKFPQLRELSLGLRSNYSFLGPRNFDAQLPLQYLAIQGHEEVGNWLAQLQMAVHGQQNGFLQRLEFVRVDDCGDVRPPFPAKLLRALKNLKSVEIEDCKSLEEVFELGEPDEGSSEEKELLSSLTMLDLQRLPEVKCIWKGPTRYVSLQSLNILKLRSLDKLTFIFTPSLARSLPKLAGLYINNCAELQHIIREEAGEREIIQESPGFPELKTIIIEECGKLEYVFPVSVSPSLLNLEEMRIFKAHNLKQIFYSVEGDALTTDGIIKFPKLRKLSISNCSFFGPKNFAAQLPSLQYLKIDGHKELGNLSAQIQGLTNLKTLRLKSLPDMSCIWKGLVLSKLTTLEMAVHGQQNDFLQRLKYVEVDDCGDVRAPFPAKLLRALKILSSVQIEDCKSLEEVFELGEPYEGSSEEKELPLPSSLTWLRLYQLPELKCIWKGPTSHVSLQSLAYLYLNSLDKLTFIFTPSLVQSLPQLESLHINKCGELKHIIREEDGEREIIPEPPCFPKLKTISIKECGKLEYVFPVSVSPSLLNLEEMQIFEAHNLKQIFYSGEGDALTRDAIIKFPKLRRLSLSNCSFFATKNFAAQLPSLQILEIDGHKELGNLFAQLQGFTNLKELRLHHLPDTRCVWKGLSKLTTLKQNGFLQRLKFVRVDDCGDVRTPFPAKLLRALNNLKKVIVDSCKSLEEVFELGEPDEGSSEEKELPLLSSLTELRLSCLPELKCIWKGPSRHVSLQSLNRLNLESLNKLTFIFTPSLARSLPKLERLYISKCGQLKHIIREENGEKEIIPESPGQDDQASPINVEKEIVLPNLKELSLEQLSSIVCFSFGWCDYFLFPRLEKLKVHQCPRLTTKFATTPDGSMSAQSEVSEVAEYSSFKREWTRNNGWKEVEEEEEEEEDDDDVGSEEEEEEEEEEEDDDDDC
ncbi:uncharacterized protein LOC18096055 isoform X6 [Populus trichocarpa]|uniref:uncharacterized protein LOC18096055 isoform X6 n=1 Tax=Populus trichocarpa TaxID=3694 RepID=UPI0022777B05|nr:uncharacterized protein LOC18096055 isoform X6 [Populus trichocarpa]